MHCFLLELLDLVFVRDMAVIWKTGFVRKSDHKFRDFPWQLCMFSTMTGRFSVGVLNDLIFSFVASGLEGKHRRSYKKKVKPVFKLKIRSRKD